MGERDSPTNAGLALSAASTLCGDTNTEFEQPYELEYSTSKTIWFEAHVVAEYYCDTRRCLVTHISLLNAQMQACT